MTFTAIVATSLESSNKKLRGVEVLLEDGGRRRIVYLDEEIISRDDEKGILPDDSLRIFELGLADLVAGKNKIFAERVTGGATVGAFNRTLDAKSYEGNVPVPSATVLDAGWYWNSNEQGVIIQCPYGPYGQRDFNFPGADLAKVRDAIALAREYFGVSEHSPDNTFQQSRTPKKPPQ